VNDHFLVLKWFERRQGGGGPKARSAFSRSYMGSGGRRFKSIHSDHTGKLQTEGSQTWLPSFFALLT
jgi:hypothetical protein